MRRDLSIQRVGTPVDDTLEGHGVGTWDGGRGGEGGGGGGAPHPKIGMGFFV